MEEKQKQRRLQSAGPVRSTISTSDSFTSNSTIISTPMSNFYSRTREDLVSHPIECKAKDEKLNSSWSTSNGFENLAASFNSDLSFKDEPSPSTPEPAPVTNTEQFPAPQVNASRLGDPEVIDKCGSENESEETVQVKPWHDESKLDESVLEDCSNIDITRVLKDLKNFINGKSFWCQI